MPKIRNRKSSIEDFGNNADQSKETLDPSAARGKKNGGKDILLTLNAYENDALTRAAESDNRTFMSFVRNAAVQQAKKIIDENE